MQMNDYEVLKTYDFQVNIQPYMSQNAIPNESGFNSECRVVRKRKTKYFFGMKPLQIFKMVLIFLIIY